MFLRGHGYCRSLAIGSSLAAGQPRFPSAILKASTTQVIRFSTQKWLTPRQLIHPRRSHTAAVVGTDGQYPADPIPTISPAEPEIPKTLPRFRKPRFTFGQAQHDLRVESRDQWNGETHADQVAALLRSNSELTREEKGSYSAVYGKNQQDKRLVNQLLKDKGQLSYDWRIPLLQLEQHYRSQGGHRAALSSVEGKGLVRKVEYQDLIRTVFSNPKRHKIARLAREVPRPTEWSEATFSQYVTDVAGSQVSQIKIPRILKPQRRGWSNNADVVKIFEDIFYDAAMKKFVSVEACNTALQFYYKYGLISKARTLYDQMDTLKMRIATKTFNILLRGAASNKDLHNFTFLLHNMLKRGFFPDEETWLSLLIAVNSREVRAVLRQKMEEKTILENPHTRRAVAALMIPNEVDFHVGNGRDPNTFLDHMDARYGTAWLTTGAGNFFLSEISKLRPVTDSLKLLERMKERGFIADEVTLNTLLHKGMPSRSRMDIMEALHFCDSHFRLRPGSMGYQTLFLQAWNDQLLNFARVIWRSACIDGCVTFKMRQLVFRRLIGHEPKKSSRQFDDIDLQNRNMSNLFRLIAGDFVVGVGQPQTTELAELGRALWVSKTTSKATSIKRARLRLNIDALIAGTCRLKVPLPALLQQALELDQKWLADRAYKTNNPQKLIQDGIQVEVDRDEMKLLQARKMQKAMTLPQATEPLNKPEDT